MEPLPLLEAITGMHDRENTRNKSEEMIEETTR
jgi:hypothetical protein